jgi:hypothetical protein
MTVGHEVCAAPYDLHDQRARDRSYLVSASTK